MKHMKESKEIKINVLNKYKIDQSLMKNSNYIYIGRGSIFGNPFTHLNLNETKAEFHVNSREESILKYKEYFKNLLLNDKDFKKEFNKLIKIYENYNELNLICFCKPKNCHGNLIKSFLKQIINTKL